MTDTKNEWVAEMPVVSVANAGDAVPTFAPSVYQDIFNRCNTELAKAREEREFWKRKHAEDNEGLMFQLGRNLEFAREAVFRSGSTEVGPTIRCIQIVEDALTAARARIAELEKIRDSALTVLDEYSCRVSREVGEDCDCLPCRLRATMRGGNDD